MPKVTEFSELRAKMPTEDRAEAQRLADQDLKEMPLQEPVEPVLDTKDRRICSKCIEDGFLRARIEKEGHDGACFYWKKIT
jgi:hypothetical protein